MNHAEATRIYAGYLNAPRKFFSHDNEEQALFDQDLARARAVMEKAWLDETLVLSMTVDVSDCLTRFGRISSELRSLRESLRRPSRRRKPR